MASSSHAGARKRYETRVSFETWRTVLPEIGAMNCRQLRVYYEGKVQGVGFRYSVKTLVSGFEVTGIVRNLPDGRVELVAEGSEDELKAFQQAIRESELGHFIRREDMAWGAAEGIFRGFEIVR